MAKKTTLNTDIDKTIIPVKTEITVDENTQLESAVYTGDDFPFQHANEFVDDRNAFTPGVYQVKGGGYKPKPVESVDTTNSSIQDIIREKVPGKEYYVDASGRPYFKQWDQKDVQDLDDMFKLLKMGDLERYKGPLAKLMRNTDEQGRSLDFDAGEFQDLVGKAFTKDLEKIAPRIKIDDLKEQALKLNRSTFYKKLLTRNSTDGMDNAMYMRLLLESQLLIIKLKNHSNLMVQNGYSPQTDAAWREMFNYLGVLVTEGAAVARLSAQKLTITQNVGGSQLTSDEFLDGLVRISDEINDTEMPVGQNKMMDNVKTFLDLSNSQIDHAAELAAKKGPNWLDSAAEIYVNSLLWHPWTIGVNSAGNVAMQLTDMAETFGAAALNKIPGYSSADGVALGEATDYMAAIALGVNRGFKQMREYAKTGETIGGTNKLDFRYSGNATSGKLLDGTKLGDLPVGGNILKTSLNILGAVNNVPKHAMIFTDELTKGIIFDVELMKIASREHAIVLKRTGDAKQADEAYQKVIHDPSEEQTTRIFNAMQERTFQAEMPEGIFKKAQTMANSPGVKFFLPFYKTMVNLFLQTSKRTPAAAIALIPGINKLTPNLKKDFDGTNGRAAQQMALSRMVMGTAFFTTLGAYVYKPGDFGEQKKDVIITGTPPINKNERALFYQNGLLPNSVCTLNPETDGYRCTSYAGLEPVGKLMAFTADAAQMLNVPQAYGDEGATAEEIAYAWFNVAYDYVGEQSFVEVFGDVEDFFGQAEAARGDTVLLNGLFQKSLDIFGAYASLGVGRSSGIIPKFNSDEMGNIIMNQDPTAYLERITDDERKNYSINSDQLYGENFFVRRISKGEHSSWNDYYNGDIPPSLEAFYKKMNKITHTSPLYNSDLKPEVTEFGRVVKNPKKRSFFAVSETDGNLLYNFFNSTGLLLDYSAKTIGGVKLTSDEKHDFMMYMNEDLDGDGVSDYKKAMLDKISSKDFLLLGQKYDRHGNRVGRNEQQRQLRLVQTEYKDYATSKILQDGKHTELVKRYQNAYNSVADVGLSRADEYIEGY